LCRIDYSEQTRKLTLGQRSPSDEVYESFVVWRSGQLFVAGWGDPLYRSFQANCVPFPAHFRIKAY